MLNIIKEYCEEKEIAVVRTDCYGKSLDLMMTLYNEAKKDFPNLTEKDVTINKYDGSSLRNIYGLEFTAHNPPDEYRRIIELEKLS